MSTPPDVKVRRAFLRPPALTDAEIRADCQLVEDRVHAEMLLDFEQACAAALAGVRAILATSDAVDVIVDVAGVRARLSIPRKSERS